MAQTIGDLVRAAAAGDRAAWSELVDHFGGLLWSIARGYGLNRQDAEDVSQTAWLKLLENLGQIRDPDRVGAWLAATARHECIRVLRKSGRQIPVADLTDIEAGPTDPASEDEVDARLLASERKKALAAALRLVSEPCRLLLRVLLADPTPTYEEVAAALDMPIGSIGPSRMRCLARLRRILERSGIKPEDGDS